MLIFNLRYRQAPCTQISTNSSHPIGGVNFHLLILVYFKLAVFRLREYELKAQISLIRRMETLFQMLLF